jgi:predicted glutamine amidotransferase
MVAEFGEKEPELGVLLELLRDQTAALARLGPFNFLLSNGRTLFAHCATSLSYVVRQAPFRSAHLIDEDFSVDFSEVTTERDRVAIIATAPLTDNESWTAYARSDSCSCSRRVPCIRARFDAAGRSRGQPPNS